MVFDLKKILVNLKKVNNLVKVSPTEPSPKADVWLKKGKNLFNLKNAILSGGYSSTTIVSQDNNQVTIKGIASTMQYLQLRCYLAKGTYTFQRKWELIEGTQNFSTGLVAINDITDTNSVIYLGEIQQNNSSLTFSIDHDAQIQIYLYLTSISSLTDTVQVKFYDVQIVNGDAEEDYEEYVEPEIYVKNNNNEYILFKENKTINIKNGYEFETGKIINGEKEYGIFFDYGALPNSTTKGQNTGLSNDNTYINIRGIARKNDGTKYYVIPSQKIEIEFENGWLIVKTTEDLSMFNANFEIYYTKKK